MNVEHKIKDEILRKRKPLKIPVSKIDASDLRAILSHPDNQWKLFPHRKILLSQEPYNIMPSNTEILIDRCCEILCTYVNQGDFECSVLSLGQCFQTPKGMRYDIEIYTKDLQLAFDHITKHMQLSYKYYKRGVHSIWVFLPAHLPEDLLCDLLKSSFPGISQTQKSSISLFELDINSTSKL